MQAAMMPRAAREHGALVVEAAHQHSTPPPSAPRRFGRHLAVLEEHRPGVRAAHAELVELGAERQALEPFSTMNAVMPLGPCVEVGLGVDTSVSASPPLVIHIFEPFST